MKNILITGAFGQLGLVLQRLLSNKFNLTSTSYSTKNTSHFGTQIAKLDVTKPASVKDAIDSYNPDIIINCAAATNVDRCEKDHNFAYSINVHGVENLIKHCKKNTRIIHISTDYVFDGNNKQNYEESDSPYPINYYGKTKLQAENILRGSNLSYSIIRSSMLYGAPMSSKQNFFSWVHDSLIKSNKIKVVDNIFSNPTWLQQLGDVIFQIIILNSTGIYHFGSSDQVSRYEFACKIADVFDLDSQLIEPVKLKELDFLAKRPKMTTLSNEKTFNELGVNPYPIEYCLCRIKENTILV